MGNVKQEPGNPLDPSTVQRIEMQIKDKVHSGYTAPRGWLFRDLSFFFFSPNTDVEDEGARALDLGLTLTQNTARFAGASSVTSVESPGITHVIVNPETTSSTDIASLRKSLAARIDRKVPHLVSSKWVEESWKNETLLDEESKLSLYLILPRVSIGSIGHVRSNLIYALHRVSGISLIYCSNDCRRRVAQTIIIYFACRQGALRVERFSCLVNLAY